MGLIFLFIPSFAESAFGLNLPEPAMTPLFGQVLLVIAYLNYVYGRGKVQQIRECDPVRTDRPHCGHGLFANHGHTDLRPIKRAPLLFDRRKELSSETALF
jgi:hypothetical protein